MTLAALFFDLDGTVVDTEELHRRAYSQTFVEFDLNWDWRPEVYAKLLNISGGEGRLRHYIDQMAVSESEKARLRQVVPFVHREKTRNYGDLIDSKSVHARPGVLRIIREARLAGIKLGFAASSAPENVHPILVSALGEETISAVNAVVCARHVERPKPAPDIYRMLLSMLSVSAKNCIAIEDSANGVAAAKAAGIFTIATPSQWTKGQDFSNADLLLSGLGEPDAPLAEAEKASIGMGYLTIARLSEIFSAPRAA